MKIRIVCVCLILCLGTSGCSDPAKNAISFVRVSNDSTNALRLIVTWNTSLPASGYVQYRDASSSTWSNTPVSSDPVTFHDAVIAGLRQSTSYVVRPVSGAVVGPETTISTNALPSDFPTSRLVSSSGAVATTDITIGGFPAPISAIVAVDGTGNIVWYHRDLDQSDPSSFAIAPDNRLVYQTPDAIKAVDYKGNETVLLDLTPFGERAHHDFLITPSGNYLYLVHKKILINNQDWCTDKIVERDTAGNLVWEWETQYHATELGGFVLNQSVDQTSIVPGCGLDWTHANSIHLITSAGQSRYLLLSIRNMNRIVKIDHATGDIVWQLGNGLSFAFNGAQPAELQWFLNQHSARLLPDTTDVLLFDNGNRRYTNTSDNFSRALIYRLDETNMTAEIAWEFNFKLFAPQAGNVQHLPSGNILITFPTNYVSNSLPAYTFSSFLEVNRTGNLLWQNSFSFADSVPTNFILGSLRISSLYDLIQGPGSAP